VVITIFITVELAKVRTVFFYLLLLLEQEIPEQPELQGHQANQLQESSMRTRSNQTAFEPSPSTGSKQLKTIRDIREALSLPESSGRGIQSMKDCSKKKDIEFQP
jgi:hypothetical protein